MNDRKVMQLCPQKVSGSNGLASVPGHVCFRHLRKLYSRQLPIFWPEYVTIGLVYHNCIFHKRSLLRNGFFSENRWKSVIRAGRLYEQNLDIFLDIISVPRIAHENYSWNLQGFRRMNTNWVRDQFKFTKEQDLSEAKRKKKDLLPLATFFYI